MCQPWVSQNASWSGTTWHQLLIQPPVKELNVNQPISVAVKGNIIGLKALMCLHICKPGHSSPHEPKWKLLVLLSATPPFNIILHWKMLTYGQSFPPGAYSFWPLKVLSRLFTPVELMTRLLCEIQNSNVKWTRIWVYVKTMECGYWSNNTSLNGILLLLKMSYTHATERYKIIPW